MGKLPDITFQNKLLPKKGRILLSDPFLNDEYFERSVVFLCEHSKEGSFGFVLNHFVELNLKELNEQFPDFKARISVGGPVENETLYFMHSLGEMLNESLEIASGIFVGGDFDQLYEVLTNEHLENDQIRFFLGYSGWSEGQLERELDEHAWVVTTIDSADEILTTKEGNLWKYFMEKLGPKYKMLSNFPVDPSEN